MQAPAAVFLSFDTVLAEDVTIGPNVVFGPGVIVERGAGDPRLLPSGRMPARVAGAIVGPFARLRPGTGARRGRAVGNFVELKAAMLGEGAKANHLDLSWRRGDRRAGATSAPARSRATTMACASIGPAMGDGAFIGSNGPLVAPVAIGEGGYVAAGSTITRNVAPDALALGRARQEEKPGRAARCCDGNADRGRNVGTRARYT